jgi:hypothetical protein
MLVFKPLFFVSPSIMVVWNNADISISSLKVMSLVWTSDDEDTGNHFGNQLYMVLLLADLKDR